MKQEISPVVAAVVVVCLLAVVGFFIWRGTAGGVKRELTADARAHLMMSGGSPVGGPTGRR